ncbi:MAG: SURF1 family protein [Candidatus Nanopelagicales bacterium]
MARPTANELWRLARTPAYILRALLGLLLIALFIFLGHWQWERTQDALASERASAAVPVAVDDLNQVGQPITNETVGRPVIAVGVYQPALQRVVVQRELHDSPGVWVVTPLRLADGSLIAVMRGWLPAVDAPGIDPPSGEVRIQGVLQADESFYKGAEQAAGSTVAAISQQSLNWGPAARAGYVTLQSQVPDAKPSPQPVPVNAQANDVAFPLQNFFYAFQWWVFALFVVGVYFRWLWLDAQAPTRDEALD